MRREVKAKRFRKRPWMIILLHWVIVLSFCLSFLTGLTIHFTNVQSDVFPDWFSSLRLSGEMIHWHILSAVFTIFTALTYALFLIVLNDTARLSLTKSLRLLVKPRKNKQWALKVLSYWLLYLLLSLAIISGCFLFYYPTGLSNGSESTLTNLHAALSIFVLIGILIHILTQYSTSGLLSFATIFLPKLGKLRYSVLTLCGGLLLMLVILLLDSLSSPKLDVVWTDLPPMIDGKADDEQWQKTDYFTVVTVRGAKHQTDVPVTIKALYDQKSFYFLARWPDPTLSISHLPLVKTNTGWKVLHQGFNESDETVYYEDKFALMIADDNQLAGNATIHHGENPLAEKPSPLHGRGLHYTREINSIVDVWHWKSVRTGSMGLADDEFFGPPLDSRPCEKRYTGGYYPDPIGGKTYKMNWLWFNKDHVVPKRLPIKPDKLRMPKPDIPSMSDTWATDSIMHWDQTLPYSEELDNYPVGTLLPSVLLLGKSYGDRGNVQAQASWENGYWTLEMARRLQTRSAYDVNLEQGVYIWVATFDHAQTQHSRHLKGIKLEFSSVPENQRDKVNRKRTLKKNRVDFKYASATNDWKFTKVSKTGKSMGDLEGPWSCIKDSKTGLLWEVKSDNEGPRFKDWSYSWFNNKQGHEKGGICNRETINCDTRTIIEQMNKNKLCGRDNWRLPTMKELQSLLYPSLRPKEASIPSCYFPHVAKGAYWSSDRTLSKDGLIIKALDFSTGQTQQFNPQYQAYVRLVSDASLPSD